MIFYHKKNKEYFNYNTNTKKYYYLNNNLTGKTSWSWETHVKSGTLLRLAPNLIGAWQDE